MAAIRTVWDKLPLLYNPGPNVTVDERLVTFRRCCPFRQYMPSKLNMAQKSGQPVIQTPVMDSTRRFLMENQLEEPQKRTKV